MVEVRSGHRPRVARDGTTTRGGEVALPLLHESRALRDELSCDEVSTHRAAMASKAQPQTHPEGRDLLELQARLVAMRLRARLANRSRRAHKVGNRLPALQKAISETCASCKSLIACPVQGVPNSGW